MPDIQPYRADGVGALTVRRPSGLPVLPVARRPSPVARRPSPVAPASVKLVSRSAPSVKLTSRSAKGRHWTAQFVLDDPALSQPTETRRLTRGRLRCVNWLLSPRPERFLPS
ncbi:hypothetical protein DKM27_12640 [Mycobacterium tuberculosis variant bovis]|nr:hypothetical protein DKM27_12640 [Mycobacterium tuberculosis variant bovis]